MIGFIQYESAEAMANDVDKGNDVVFVDWTTNRLWVEGPREY